MSRTTRMVAFLVAAIVPAASLAQEKDDPSRLTVQRIFGGGEFEPEHVAIRWLAVGSGYVTLEPSIESRAGETWSAMIPATGEKRVLVSAAEPDSAQGIFAASGRGLCVLARPIATAHFHQLQARLAGQHAGRLLGARPGGPRVAETGRGRCARLAHARQVCPERLAGRLCA